MASINYIQQRIASKEKEIQKLEGKLVRIRKAEESGWENNPYCYSNYDLKSTLKNLESSKQSLEKYKEDLRIAEEKASSRNVKVILDFLEMWKDRNREFYSKAFPQYLTAVEEYQQKKKEYCDYRNNGGFRDPNRNEVRAKFDRYKKTFQSTWNFINPYVDNRQNPTTYKFELVFDMEKLNKDLDEEANRKYDFIIEKTNAIVGTITDASHLMIGDKQDLNGFIIGTKGTAKVQTIGAGGYNIQCFHFRTLITPVQ